MFYSLLLVPIFVGLYLRGRKHRQRMAAAYGGFGLADQAAGPSGMRRHLPSILFLVSLTILFAALSRPSATVSLPSVESTVILAFDVSGSMSADDLQPTRMEAAKAAARDFVENQPARVLIGVVAFSDGGFSIQPPTKEREAVLTAIDRLEPERGTSLANGILSALNLIVPETAQSPSPALTPTPTPTPLPKGTYQPAVIILFSDGENNMSPDPLDAAKFAEQLGVRVYTIGIGSPAGAVIQVEGFSVHTVLNEALLQQIAETTGGKYYNAQSEEDLRAIYDGIDPQLVIKTEEIEVTSMFAGAGMLLLLIGGAASLLWFGHVP